MRKDVRLGLAVGGILFGVVLIYVLFFAGGDTQGEDPVAIDTTSESATGSAGADILAGGASSETGMTIVPGPATNTQAAPPARGNPQFNPQFADGPATKPALPEFSPPVAASTLNWRDLMKHGMPNGAPVFSETPTPGGGRPMQDLILEQPPLSPQGPQVPNLSTGQRTYRVKPGETFWSIARSEYGNSSYYAHIQRANPRIDPEKLRAGMEITLPAAGEVIPQATPQTALTPTPVTIDETRQYRVKKGDNLSRIAQNLYGRASMAGRIYELNRDVIGPNPSALKLNMILTLPEPPGRVATAAGAN